MRQTYWDKIVALKEQIILKLKNEYSAIKLRTEMYT